MIASDIQKFILTCLFAPLPYNTVDITRCTNPILGDLHLMTSEIAKQIKAFGAPRNSCL